MSSFVMCLSEAVVGRCASSFNWFGDSVRGGVTDVDSAEEGLLRSSRFFPPI